MFDRAEKAKKAIDRFRTILRKPDLPLSTLFTERRHLQSCFGEAFQTLVYNEWLRKWQVCSDRDRTYSRRAAASSWTPPKKLYQTYLSLLRRSTKRANRIVDRRV